MTQLLDSAPNSSEHVALSGQEMLLGKHITPVVFGTSRYATSSDRDPSTGFFLPDHTSETREISLIQSALMYGYNVIDTARAYGDAESIVGQAIAGVERESVVIATKVGIRPTADIIASIRGSAIRLGTDPDIVFIHDRWKDAPDAMDECLRQLDIAVSGGLTRAIGISNFQPHELRHALEVLEHPVAAYQAKLNLVNPRKDAAELIDICREHGIPFMASSALDRGNALGQSVDPVVTEIAQKYRMSLSQVAIFAIRALGAIPVVQTHDEHHMKDNLQALSYVMDRGDVDTLRQLLLGNVAR